MAPPNLPPRGERGQASAELAALLPLIAVVLAVCWQVVLVGQAAWSASSAARAAARAHAVGADLAAAARASLPRALERDLRVRPLDDGRVEVRLRVPTVVPAIDVGSLTAHARFQPQA
jgi:hypothetical protein